MASKEAETAPSPIDEVNMFFQCISAKAVGQPEKRAPEEESTAANSATQPEERPNKWAKDNAKGDAGRGKGRSQSKPRPSRRSEAQSSWQNWGGNSQSSWQRDTDQINEAVRLLARMALRHEDELSQTRIEKEFILTMEVHGGGVLPMMYQVAQAWKESREKGEVFSSLRLTMLLALFQEWLERMARITEEQALAGAIKLGICQMEPGQELEWLYLTWDAESKKLIRDRRIP